MIGIVQVGTADAVMFSLAKGGYIPCHSKVVAQSPEGEPMGGGKLDFGK